MLLRTIFSDSISDKPIVAALAYITKRLNLWASADHDPGTGHHTRIFERGRTVALGAPIDVPYDPANFTGSTTGTPADWIVDAADQATYRYSLSGDQMTVAFRIAFTNVANAPTQLWIRIPGGYVATSRVSGVCFLNNAGVIATGRVIVQAFTSGPVTGAVLELVVFAGGAFTNTAANNTTVEGELTFWVRAL